MGPGRGSAVRRFPVPRHRDEGLCGAIEAGIPIYLIDSERAVPKRLAAGDPRLRRGELSRCRASPLNTYRPCIPGGKALASSRAAAGPGSEDENKRIPGLLAYLRKLLRIDSLVYSHFA